MNKRSTFADVDKMLSDWRKDGPSTGDSVLAGPIFTASPDPTECKTCGKSGERLLPITRGQWECSAVSCPIRKRLSAAPRDLTDWSEFVD